MDSSMRNNSQPANASAENNPSSCAETPFDTSILLASPEICFPITDKLERDQPEELEDPFEIGSNLSLGMSTDLDLPRSEPQNTITQALDLLEDADFPIEQLGNLDETLQSSLSLENMQVPSPDTDFFNHALSTFCESPMLRTDPSPQLAEENNPENREFSHQFQIEQQPDMMDTDQLDAFQFENTFQAEQPLFRQNSQSDQYNSMSAEPFLQNFNNSNIGNNQEAWTNPALPSPNTAGVGATGYTRRAPFEARYQNPLHGSLGTGAQFLADQLQPHLGQVPEITHAENHHPAGHNNLQHLRSQHNTPYHVDQFAMSPYNHQGSGSATVIRQPQPMYHHQFDRDSLTPAISDFHEPISLQMARNSKHTRHQQLNGRHLPPILPRLPNSHVYGWANEVPRTPRFTDPLEDMSLLAGSPAPPSSARLPSIQSLLNRPLETSASYSSGRDFHQTPFFRSATQQDVGRRYPAFSTAPHLLGNSSTRYRERGIMGQHENARSRFEFGESSKRPRIERPWPTQMTRSQENEEDRFSQTEPRPLKNALYDPVFEGIGLPVDPHLRLFTAT